jgi:hypothetical protein
MNEFAPTMPPVKAVGDWFNRKFPGRSNIREFFLLEWAAYALDVARQTDPKDERLLKERLKEAKLSIAEVAGLLSDEIEGKLTSNEMERLKRVSGTAEPSLLDVLRVGIESKKRTLITSF